MAAIASGRIGVVAAWSRYVTLTPVSSGSRRPAECQASQPGITVTPPGDTPGVSTQLRLVEPPAPAVGSSGPPPAAAPGRPPRHARARRTARWDVRLAPRRRHPPGRAGPASPQARRALEAATRPPSKDRLSQAS